MADFNTIERLRTMKARQMAIQGDLIKRDFENIRILLERGLINAAKPIKNTVVTVDFLDDRVKMKVLDLSEYQCASGLHMFTIISKDFRFGHEKYNMTEWFNLTYGIDYFEVIDEAIYAIW